MTQDQYDAAVEAIQAWAFENDCIFQRRDIELTPFEKLQLHHHRRRIQEALARIWLKSDAVVKAVSKIDEWNRDDDGQCEKETA